MRTGPLSAIKMYCYWCCGDSHEEATLCPAVECSIHPLRKGQKPSGFNKSVLKAIKERCLDCSGFQISEVRNCWDDKCTLYPFRVGKNPNRKVITYETINQDEPIGNTTVSKGEIIIKSYEQGEPEDPQSVETGIEDKDLQGEKI